MASSRNLAIFVLLAQLVSFSMGNIEGGFEKNLRNASKILSEDKLPEDSVNELGNVTSLKNVDNISMSLETTTSLSGLINEEKKIEAELKNVLEEAALSGQLIVLSSSQAQKSNLSNIISGPLIMIEDLSTTSQSPISQPRTTNDQEIAQSQIRTRTRPRNYDDREDIENIEDLLAIAEYEPQKLDAQRDGTTNTEASIVESTIHNFPEELHYDVPRRRNRSTPKTHLDDSPTQLTPTESSEDSPQPQRDRMASRLQLPEYNYKADRRKPSLALKFRENLSSPQEKWLRGTRHLKPILLPSQTDPLTSVVPRMPNGDLQYPKANRSHLENLTNISESTRTEFRPLQRTIIPATLPLTYPTVGTNQVPMAPQREFREPHTVTFKQPRPADRRSDDYLQYGTPKIRSIPNDHQLGSFNRYNLPSRMIKRLMNSYPYPSIPIATHQPQIPAKDTETESIEPDSPEKKLHYDYYEDSTEQGHPSQQKPYTVGDPRERTSKAEIIPAYDSSEDSVHPESSKLYQNGAKPLLNSAERDYESYETDEITAGPKSRLVQSDHHAAIEKIPSAPANRFVALPTKLINYKHLQSTSSPLGGINLANTPIYPYRNVYSNPKPILPDSGFIKNEPGSVTKHSREFHQTEKAYEHYKDPGDRSPRLEVIREAVPNQNDVEERYRNLKSTKKPLTQGSKPNEDSGSGERTGNDHRKQLKNTPGPFASPPVTFDPRSTFVAPIQLPDRSRPKSSPVINGNLANDYKISLPTSPTQLQKVESSGGQSGGQDADYDFYDSYKSINVPPVIARPTQPSGESAHYGNRVRSLNVPEQQKPSPSPTTTRQTISLNLVTDRSQQPRIIPVTNHVEPAESIHRSHSLPDAQSYDDEVPASSGHEENHETHAEARKDEGGDEESVKGGGEKHEEAHHGSSGEKAEKDYKEWHEYDKGKKGHHDKEYHDNEYHEEKGGKKKHEDESDYHKEHHHGEKGSKESEFAEKGKHEKGHSTKGEHVIHKKDEYEKKTEFYDESHEEDGDEKEGEYHYEHEDKKGGHEKIGHHDSAFNVDKYGEKGEHEKGQHWHETKGHEKKDGREQDHSHEEKYGKKGAHEEGEKWSHNNGDKRQR